LYVGEYLINLSLEVVAFESLLELMAVSDAAVCYEIYVFVERTEVVESLEAALNCRRTFPVPLYISRYTTTPSKSKKKCEYFDEI